MAYAGKVRDWLATPWHTTNKTKVVLGVLVAVILAVILS